MIVEGMVLWSDDRDANLAEVCQLLRSGKATQLFLNDLANMIDPQSTTRWRLKMSRRNKGRPSVQAFTQHADILEVIEAPPPLKKQRDAAVGERTGVGSRQARRKVRRATEMESERRGVDDEVWEEVGH